MKPEPQFNSPYTQTRGTSLQPDSFDHDGTATPEGIADLLAASRQAGLEYSLEAASSSNTQRAYDQDWAHFEEWCISRGVESFPASGDVVAAYFLERSNLVREDGNYRYAASTITRWISGINHKHRISGLPLPGSAPEVRGTLIHIRRARTRPVRRKTPILANDLKKVLAGIDCRSYPAGVSGRRDAAMLILAFAGALRGVDLTASTVGDVIIRDDGLWLRLSAPQTRRQFRGSFRGMAPGTDPETCPPCALLRWTRLLAARTHPSWPEIAKELSMSASRKHVCQADAIHLQQLDPTAALFPTIHRGGHISGRGMSPGAFYKVVMRRTAKVGLDSSIFGAHSLRAGFITQAIETGAQTHEIVRHVGLKHASSVDAYRPDTPQAVWDSAAGLGL